MVTVSWAAVSLIAWMLHWQGRLTMDTSYCKRNTSIAVCLNQWAEGSGSSRNRGGQWWVRGKLSGWKFLGEVLISFECFTDRHYYLLNLGVSCASAELPCLILACVNFVTPWYSSAEVLQAAFRTNKVKLFFSIQFGEQCVWTVWKEHCGQWDL